MPTSAKILADSISEAGARLTSFQVRCPRIAIPQLTRHRALSFSIRSHRAVPVAKLIAEVESDPVIPRFGKAARGMQAPDDLDELSAKCCVFEWLRARDLAVESARRLAKNGAAKEVVNRVIESYCWSDLVVTATDWDNLFALRIHPDAQHECREACLAMARAMRDSTPAPIKMMDWHLPYVTPQERAAYHPRRLAEISAARCARVSYRPHDAEDADAGRDLRLAAKLHADHHVSPYEHQASPFNNPEKRSGNFRGWFQARQLMGDNVATSFDWSILDATEGRP